MLELSSRELHFQKREWTEEGFNTLSLCHWWDIGWTLQKTWNGEQQKNAGLSSLL